MRMLDGLEANVSSLDGEGNFTFLEDFEVFTFRDAINVAAYMVMSAGHQGRAQKELILKKTGGLQP